MTLEPHHSRKFEPTRNLPEGYLECGNAQLAYDPVKCQYVWPGGKRMIDSEARANVEYLDRIISGELPMVINESGYVCIRNLAHRSMVGLFGGWRDEQYREARKDRKV